MAKRKYGDLTHGSQRIFKRAGPSEHNRKMGGRKTRRVEQEDCFGVTDDSEFFDGGEAEHGCDDSQGSGRYNLSDRSESSSSSRSESFISGGRRKCVSRKFEGRGKGKGKEYRRSDFTEVYRNPNKKVREVSKGSRVKSRNAVVSTQAKMCARPPNVICRVEMFHDRVITCFDPSRVAEVNAMGFGGLLDLKMSYLPRQICYWIMSRIQSGGVLEFGVGQELPLSPVQLQCVLGIPMADMEVPSKPCTDDPAMMKRVAEITKVYRSGGQDGDLLSLEKAISVLTDIEVDVNGKLVPLGSYVERMKFRTAFLIVALGAILCPLTKWGVLAKNLVAAVSLARDADKYDWCTFVFDWLMKCVAAFADKFEENGYAAGCGGCAAFLLIFYLDHLKRPPVRWGIFPRVKVWTHKEISKAISEDSRRSSDDYGKLKSVLVAYGEAHPCAVTDSSTTVVENVALEVAKLLKPQLEQMVSEAVRHHILEGGFVNSRNISDGAPGIEGSSRRRQRMFVHVSDDEETVFGDDEQRMPSTPLNVGCGAQHLDIHESDIHAPNEREGLKEKENNNLEEPALYEQPLKDVNPNDENATSMLEVDPTSEADSQVKSVKDNEGEELENLGGREEIFETRVVQDYEEEASKLRNPLSQEKEHGNGDDLNVSDQGSQSGSLQRSKEKRPVKNTSVVVDGQYGQGTATRRLTPLERSFLDFVRRWRQTKKKDGAGCMLVLCQGVHADHRDCYGVLLAKEYVSNGYVRMAARLYTKRWECHEFPGKSRRILLPPEFSDRAVKPGTDLNKLALQFRNPLANIKLAELGVVFLPVLEGEHWWCVAFNLNGENIWLMDSVYPDPWKTHEPKILRVVSAVDHIINSLHRSWKVTTMTSWPHRAVEILHPTDHRSCGVVMLSCIKACAHRFQVNFSLNEKIEDARVNLLLDDAMSEFNEERKNLIRRFGIAQKDKQATLNDGNT